VSNSLETFVFLLDLLGNCSVCNHVYLTRYKPHKFTYLLTYLTVLPHCWLSTVAQWAFLLAGLSTIWISLMTLDHPWHRDIGKETQYGTWRQWFLFSFYCTV